MKNDNASKTRGKLRVITVRAVLGPAPQTQGLLAQALPHLYFVPEQIADAGRIRQIYDQMVALEQEMTLRQLTPQQRSKMPMTQTLQQAKLMGLYQEFAAQWPKLAQAAGAPAALFADLVSLDGALISVEDAAWQMVECAALGQDLLALSLTTLNDRVLGVLSCEARSRQAGRYKNRLYRSYLDAIARTRGLLPDSSTRPRQVERRYPPWYVGPRRPLRSRPRQGGWQARRPPVGPSYPSLLAAEALATTGRDAPGARAFDPFDSPRASAEIVDAGAVQLCRLPVALNVPRVAGPGHERLRPDLLVAFDPLAEAVGDTLARALDLSPALAADSGVTAERLRAVGSQYRAMADLRERAALLWQRGRDSRRVVRRAIVVGMTRLHGEAQRWLRSGRLDPQERYRLQGNLRPIGDQEDKCRAALLKKRNQTLATKAEQQREMAERADQLSGT